MRKKLQILGSVSSYLAIRHQQGQKEMPLPVKPEIETSPLHSIALLVTGPVEKDFKKFPSFENWQIFHFCNPVKTLYMLQIYSKGKKQYSKRCKAYQCNDKMCPSAVTPEHNLYMCFALDPPLKGTQD
jgi:hypothetical protein